MTIHLIHTTRHTSRPAMSEARRQHINGMLDARPECEPHPVVGALILSACALTVMGGLYAVALLFAALA